jgi:hypothetical protein
MIKTSKVEVERDYRCPFCPDHEDEYYFIWEGLIEAPICDACSYELGYFLLTPPDEGIWFGFDLHSIETLMLEKITGKSIHDLQMAYLLRDIGSYRDTKIFDENMRHHTEGWSKDEAKQFRKAQRRGWIQCLRHRKKLIRKLIRLHEKIQAGNIYEEILCGWRDARHINKERHSK